MLTVGVMTNFGGNAAFILGGFVLSNLGHGMFGSEGNMGYFVAGCIAFVTFMVTVGLLPDRRPMIRCYSHVCIP